MEWGGEHARVRRTFSSLVAARSSSSSVFSRSLWCGGGSEARQEPPASLLRLSERIQVVGCVQTTTRETQSGHGVSTHNASYLVLTSCSALFLRWFLRHRNRGHPHVSGRTQASRTSPECRRERKGHAGPKGFSLLTTSTRQ